MSGVGPAFLAPAEYVASPAAMAHIATAEEGRAYTRWLSTHHYENFHVVSFLLPKRLHQDFYNVYSYCRWADDLGDEIGDTAESLRLLAWWRAELDAMYAGRAAHPVFVALMPTVRNHGIPREPFADLVKAFVQDQTVTRYRTWDELFGTAVIPQIPWVGCCSTCAVTPTPNDSDFRTRRARRCNSRISGRM